MPAAYSVGATPPLTRRDSPAHSRFRFHTHAHAHAHPSPPASPPPPDSPRRGFLRLPLGARTPSRDGAAKIPWDSPLPPAATPGDEPVHRPALVASRSEAEAALLRVKSNSSEYAAEGTHEAPLSPGRAGGKTPRGGFRRLVHQGSKFSLRSTLGLAPAHPTHPSSAGSSPPTSPLSSRSSAFPFPVASSSSGRADSRAGSLDGLNQPFVGTRGYATYPREISNPQSSRAPAGAAVLMPLPSPGLAIHAAAAAPRDRKGSDGCASAKAARLLGDELVMSGKAAKILGLERERTLAKKPSSASLLVTDLPKTSPRPSLVQSSAFSYGAFVPPATPPRRHDRQRSLSVPTHYSPKSVLGLQDGYLPTPHESDADDDDCPWPRPALVTPPLGSAHAGGDSPIETSDYAGSSPTRTRRSHSPASPLRDSVESFPQTARIASFASSTFCASGVPSFYPASSAVPPDWRNSTWSARRASDDPDGPPRLPRTRRLSPESIRFSAMFAGRPSEVFGGASAGSSGEASPAGEASRTTRTPRAAAAAALQRPNLGIRSYSAGSSGGAGTPQRTMMHAGSSSSSSNRSSTAVSPLPAPPASSLPPLPPIPSLHVSQPGPPQRSSTVVSSASSHTRRSQRSHALDALEGRPRRLREASAESGANMLSAATAESIGAMERQALERGALGIPAEAAVDELERTSGANQADRAEFRKSRPFLDLEWSSDDDSVRRVPRVPLVPLPQEKGLPPLPPDALRRLLPATPDPPPPSRTPPAQLASTSAWTLTPSPSSSSSSAAPLRATSPREPTVDVRQAAAALPPVPPVPPVPPGMRASPPRTRRPSVQSVLSLSSSQDEDEADADGYCIGAFPSPPLARPGGGAGGEEWGAAEGYSFPTVAAL
ncbi:hypothetical protein JCM3770_002668 [Rhodotorula araucariae]